MQTQSAIRAPDDARIVLGLEPARAKMRPARRQPGETALELDAPLAIARHENRQIGKAPRRTAGFPATNTIFQLQYAVDDDVEVLILSPTGRTNDQADERAVNAESRQQRLAVPLAIRVRHRRENRRRPIVQNVGVLQPEAARSEEHTSELQSRFGISYAV